MMQTFFMHIEALLYGAEDADRDDEPLATNPQACDAVDGNAPRRNPAPTNLDAMETT